MNYWIDDNGVIFTYNPTTDTHNCNSYGVLVDLRSRTVIASIDGEVIGEFTLHESLLKLACIIEVCP